MITGDSKRIVIIKNISSDLIEEAILILKPELAACKGSDHPSIFKNIIKEKNEKLLKEAESIINNYIRENKLHIIPQRHMANKLFKKLSLTNLIINLLMISSIALLIYVTFRLF